MKAVILAGGRGVRLGPLTDFVAKPLLPINGRPALEQVIEILSKAGINEICIVIGHLGEQVVDFFGDGSKFGVDITYKKQEEQLGTAHALSTAGDFVEKNLLVIASDCILPSEHIIDLINFHNTNKCDATLSLKELDKDEMTQSSTVKLEADMSISKIIEKPSKEEILSNIACAPLYIFKDVRKYLSKVQKSRRGEFEIVDVIQMMIDNGLNVKGVKTDSFSHLSNLEDFLKLNFEYLDNTIK
ncbi:MAG: nucleotidyltransferase family protein [Candidatus Hydrothermarchaeales archaeon]